MELKSNEDGVSLIKRLPINEMSLQIKENFPPLINIRVPDSRTSFHRVRQQREGNLVVVELTTRRPRNEFCAEVITEISKSIQLKGNFAIGQDSTLIINDKEKNFSL